MPYAAHQGVLYDPQAIRHADPELLSLALIDSRNQLLQVLAQSESAEALQGAVRAGAFQEFWIARNVMRQQGEQASASSVRLASIEPAVDAWCRGHVAPPVDALRAYLRDTLEVTLELLSGSEATDAGLYFFRLSLQHEDRLCEALQRRLGTAAPPARAQRPTLWLPDQRWALGSTPGGLVPHNERWAHEVAVPAFDIDSQVVNWSQYAEFVLDQGYDRAELWTGAGWAWVQAQQRRSPLHVEQMRGGTLVRRGRTVQRAAPGQAAMHVSRFEAQAWCQWAGRRLPTEPEWELAACTASSRGFVWGDVFEWVAGSARAWPDAGPVPPGDLSVAPAEPCGVLRGGSFATAPRWRHPKARRFAATAADSLHAGFRSCAV